MVSLLKLAEITEEGVKFQSPFGGKVLKMHHSVVNAFFQKGNAC